MDYGCSLTIHFSLSTTCMVSFSKWRGPDEPIPELDIGRGRPHVPGSWTDETEVYIECGEDEYWLFSLGVGSGPSFVGVWAWAKFSCTPCENRKFPPPPPPKPHSY